MNTQNWLLQLMTIKVRKWGKLSASSTNTVVKLEETKRRNGEYDVEEIWKSDVCDREQFNKDQATDGEKAVLYKPMAKAPHAHAIHYKINKVKINIHF